MFADDQAVPAAVRAIRQAAGPGRKRVLRIEVNPQELVVQLQNPAARSHVDAWRFGRSGRVFASDRVTGPVPVRLNLVNPDLDANLFDLDDVDFDAAGALVRTAVVRAGLEGPAAVARIEIARTVSILPRPASGNVRWTVTVRSPRESAEIYADRGGAVVGMDLSNTTRMRTLDYLREPGLLQEAAQAFRQVLGRERILTHVSLTQAGIGFQTNLRDDTLPIVGSTPGGLTAVQVFAWRPDGLRRGWGSVMPPTSIGPPPTPFAIDDVDWTILPALVASAKDRLGMGQGQLNEAVVKAIPDFMGTPRLTWTVEILEGRETGKVVADLQGRIRNATLPPSRRVAVDWREPSSLVAVLRRIGDELPPDAAFAEISVRKERIEIRGRAKELGEQPFRLQLTPEGLAPSPFGTMQPVGRLFQLADLAPLTEERIAALQKRTLDRLGLPPGSITSISIERDGIDPSPRGDVTVVIRAEERPFGRSGRISFELDGREIVAYLPDSPSPGVFQLHADDREACSDVRDLPAMVAGCTRVIEDMTLPARERANALTNRAVAHAGTGKEEAALADLGEAIRISPGYAHAWRTRGWVNARSGRHREAIDDYTRLLEVQPSDADAHVKRGQAYAAVSEWSLALADYDGALRYARSPNLLHERGALLFDMGERTRAMADLDSALRLRPDSSSTLFVRGRLHFYDGALDAAAADFARANELEPGNAYVALWRDIAERRADRLSRLREFAAAANDADWPGPLVRLMLGEQTAEQVLAAHGTDDPARRAERECEVVFYGGELAGFEGKSAEARQAFARAAELCPARSVERIGAQGELARLR